MRELTDEELARAVHLDPSQIAGLGPSLDALHGDARRAEAEDPGRPTRPTRVQKRGRTTTSTSRPSRSQPPAKLREAISARPSSEEQLHDLERLWYRAGDDASQFARQLLQLVERLGEKYQVDELAAKYEFTGRTPMTVPEALEIKEELETIDKLLKQLEEATKTAQIGIIDMEELAAVRRAGRHRAARRAAAADRGLPARDGRAAGAGAATRGGFQLTPKAYRLFQAKLLDADLQQPAGVAHRPAPGAGRRRRGGRDAADQAVRVRRLGGAHGHPAVVRSTPCSAAGRGLPVRLKPDDIVIHRTRNKPKCATVVLLDMSGSMRYDGQYINVKRMGLALDGLIRREYPGDFLQFIEMYTFAKPRHVSRDRRR